MGVSRRLAEKATGVSRPPVPVRPAYDMDELPVQTKSFDWADVDMDLMAACPVAVLCAGDMVSLTMDRGGNSVLVTVHSDGGVGKKWCNTPADLNKHLLRVYDVAVARRNVVDPPKLLSVAR